MSTIQTFVKTTFSLGAIGLGLALSAPAFAAKDVVYPSAASATASGEATSVANSLAVGANGSTNLSEAVYLGQAVTVTAAWSIKNNSGPGTNTAYPKSVTFSASTSQTPGPQVVLNAIPQCPVTSASSTCTTDISFEAPSVPGNYEVQVSVNEIGGNTGILGRTLSVNFSVAEPVVVLKKDTALNVAKQCVLLNANAVESTATLTELLSESAIANAGIDFYLNPPSEPVGASSTDHEGIATAAIDVSSLAAGDHNLYAEYAGDAAYNPSNGSNVLGVSYLFVGFQPPINPDGTSVFGNGRVIPVKIRLVDANGQPVTDAAPTVWLTQYSSSTGLGTVMEEATSVSAADTGNVMRYVPEDGHYMYNMDLSTVANGTYAVVVDVGDSAACSRGPYHAVITVAKKKK
jgi:hypothetical protein